MLKYNKSFYNIVLVFVFILTTSVFGQGLIDNLQIHGFASQGYLKTSHNNFLISDSKKGSWEFSEAAFNVMAMPSNRLRLGMQLFARDIGNAGNHKVNIDWAFGDYRWHDYLGFRLGRFKSPTALYNTIRDVDIARIPILPAQSVYAENMRDIRLAINGINLYGYLPLSFAGDIDYEAIAGGIDIAEPDGSFWRQAQYLVGIGIANGMQADPNVISASYEGSSDQSVRFEENYIFAVNWNTPLSGLRLRGSLFLFTFNESYKADFNMVVPTGNPANPTVSIGNVMQLSSHMEGLAPLYSLEYTWNNFTLVAEYETNDLDVVMTVDGVKNPVMKIKREAHYEMISYQFDRLALSTYYSVYYSDPDDKEGKKQVALGNPDYFTWQKDICFSAKFDITENWITKLEFHSINGITQVSVIDNPDGLKENWTLFAFKTTFHF